MVTYLDASHGLAVMRSVQGMLHTFGGNVLAGASKGAAEAELLAYNGRPQTAKACISLLEIFGHQVAGGLLGDSKSAITLDTGRCCVASSRC